MKGNGKALTLENYIEFLENPHGHELTNSELNQIISMHGFRKMHHSQKVELVDALNSMDLLYPNRSTLKQNISSTSSSSASANLLSTEEVIKDLDLLDWKECTLRSIETINSSGSVEVTTRFNSSTPRHNHRDVRGRYSVKNNGSGGGGDVNKTGKRSGKRKKRSLTALSFVAPAVALPPAGSASTIDSNDGSSYWQ